ncbi:class I SAM-dependent methyltransferase [bacterium]|nr:class I SAM-dependent methyltransferase [bacterium]MBU1983521.1 class I SAM-dependent methyltransferase [bacterium]
MCQLACLWDDDQVAALREALEAALIEVRLRKGFLRRKLFRSRMERDARQTAERLTSVAMQQHGVRALTRTDVVNYIAGRIEAQSYLEIGVSDPRNNFNLVQVKHKDGVDPAGKCSHPVTSDEFFARNARVYDLIYIDGLHLAEQVLRDVENSLRFLAPRGVIALHDCNPMEEAWQIEEYDGVSLWCGTVWKAIAQLRATRSDLWMGTVHADHGVGVIMRGQQERFPLDDGQEWNYSFLDRHRRELLHLLSWRDFRAEFETQLSNLKILFGNTTHFE